ncbi:hypothetical protein CCUS01_02223 [Colletotrichum cuscutae]|uniref:Uncharacterized protein n=1 Tax=Colletotrichum cuscutae TaxID=1209917 RepID=A0AAI9U332_9PEZI|nr:hypothetical protein CCUS01_02223 [Colletotrichum cuscutae]
MRSQPESGVRTLSAAFRTPPAPTVHSPLCSVPLSQSRALSLCLTHSHLFLSRYHSLPLFLSPLRVQKSTLLNTHPSPPGPGPWPLPLPLPLSHSSLLSSTLRLTQTQHTQRNATQLLSHLYLPTYACSLPYGYCWRTLRPLFCSHQFPWRPTPQSHPPLRPLPTLSTPPSPPSHPFLLDTALHSPSEIRFSISTDDKARNLANQQILSRSGHDRFAGTRIHPHDRRLKYSRPTRKSKLETLGSGTLDSAEPRLFQLADEKQPGFGNNTIGSSNPDWKTQQLRSLRRLTISTTTTSTL